MADEFGEDPSIYVFPLGVDDGWVQPDDFYDRIDKALRSVGIGWETV